MLCHSSNKKAIGCSYSNNSKCGTNILLEFILLKQTYRIKFAKCLGFFKYGLNVQSITQFCCCDFIE